VLSEVQWAANDLFERLFGGFVPGGNCSRHNRTTKQAQCPGQRLLLLPLRRAFRSGCSCRLVLAPLSLFDPVYRRLRSGPDDFWNLVWSRRRVAQILICRNAEFIFILRGRLAVF
jgi:hypothetical protein